MLDNAVPILGVLPIFFIPNMVAILDTYLSASYQVGTSMTFKRSHRELLMWLKLNLLNDSAISPCSGLTFPVSTQL